MTRFNRLRSSTIFTLIVLGATAMVLAGVKPQSTQVNGKVTLKQADGTEVPATQGPKDLGTLQMTINGTSAISGATVFSDSTVTTAKGSSAVVSLGKLGRVELESDTSAKLTFTDTTITVGMLNAGRVRVSSSPGVNASTTTNDGQVIAAGDQKNEFTVDTRCGNTVVAVKKGRVELRAGNAVKQIAAGGQDTAGTATPGCSNVVRNKKGDGAKVDNPANMP